MKPRIVIIIALLAALALGIPFAIGQQSNFEKALVLEETQLKFKEAIALYQKVVDTSKDKALAAQAQLHIGFCYEKLGTPEAEKAFQRVLEKYSDQTETARVAREKLTALSKGRPATLSNASNLVLTQLSVPAGKVSRMGNSSH